MRIESNSTVPTLGRTAQVQFVGMGLLRKVLASRARRVCAPYDPMGRPRIKRQAQAVRAMHRVRPQGRDTTASRMGRRAYRISAIPNGVLEADFINPLAEQRHGETFAVTGGDCLFLMA